MKYLEDEKLTKLTSELTDAALGRSRSIHGRIEAYIMKRAGTDKKYAHALGRSFVAEMENVENQLADYKNFMQRHIKAAGTSSTNNKSSNTKEASSKASRRGRKRSMSAGTSVEAATTTTGPKKKQQRRRSSSYDDTMKNLAAKTASGATAGTGSATATSTTPTVVPKPLGDFGEIGTRRLMTDLILTLNASFPDYDFSGVRASDFEKIKVSNAMKRINERLSELAVEKVSFLSDMWNAMDEVVRLSECDVYSYAPKARDQDDDPLSFLTQTLIDSADYSSVMDSTHASHLHHQDNNLVSSSSSIRTVLWSFNYFFVNKAQKRIVFFSCVERMRNESSLLAPYEDELIDEEVDFVRFHGTEASDVDFDLDPSAHIAGGIPISIA